MVGFFNGFDWCCGCNIGYGYEGNVYVCDSDDTDNNHEIELVMYGCCDGDN